MAEVMYKGCDPIHKAHMTTVQEKHQKMKFIQDKRTARLAYKAALA